MPLHHYGVLKGRVARIRAERDFDKPHFQLRVDAGGRRFQVPVNVRSAGPGSAPELLYRIEEDFRHPVLDDLPALAAGFHRLPGGGGGGALDYVRGNLFDRAEMAALPHDVPGEDNDLNDELERVLRGAVGDAGIVVYVFGEAFPSAAAPTGVHNVHMNQGNPRGRFSGDNGVFQDGALLVHHTRQNRWTAVFLAFQSQAWATDDETGHPVRGGAASVHAAPRVKLVRIAAALVNPKDVDAGRESVTLLNTTGEPVALTGWTITNRERETHTLSGTLAPHASLVVRLPRTMPLTNRGGTITLLDDRGRKVDGVAYTRDEAQQEGRQVVFSR